MRGPQTTGNPRLREGNDQIRRLPLRWSAHPLLIVCFDVAFARLIVGESERQKRIFRE